MVIFRNCRYNVKYIDELLLKILRLTEAIDYTHIFDLDVTSFFAICNNSVILCITKIMILYNNK